MDPTGYVPAEDPQTCALPYMKSLGRFSTSKEVGGAVPLHCAAAATDDGLGLTGTQHRALDLQPEVGIVPSGSSTEMDPTVILDVEDSLMCALAYRESLKRFNSGIKAGGAVTLSQSMVAIYDGPDLADAQPRALDLHLGVGMVPSRSLGEINPVADLDSTKDPLMRFNSGIEAGGAVTLAFGVVAMKNCTQTPCGHNSCLKCFEKWIHNRNTRCANCRAEIPPKMAAQPRINSTLVEAIRMAKASKNANSAVLAASYKYLRNDDRPDKAFTTERAKKAGKANASSGQIFVTIAPDHFGPILAENDPKRGMGVRVGETWEDRLECRQWGAHFPHVAGIAGQSTYGAQSVALSGGYEDDEDHGEWFLYTGSGGRDLSGNKRTNKEQSSDQKFEKLNAALRISCLKGYPVRVVRSHKEKRSSYAPESGVRYDGIYRIEKCWRKVGIQGTFKVCRYLFVRCDNEPAPWTSDDHGDRPRPLPKIKELQGATDITERKGRPAWDYDEQNGWKWVVPPPVSRKPVHTGDAETDKELRMVRRRPQLSGFERLLKEFGCSICRKVIHEPLTTPCAHNFCKACLLGAYDSQSSMRERSRGGRTLRAQKIVKKCPSCPTDICDFLENPQINREMMDLIESLRRKAAEADTKVVSDGSNDAEECGDDLEENDGALGNEEDDSSLNEEEQDSAEDKKTECRCYDSDVNADGSVEIVVETKEDGQQPKKYKEDTGKGEDGKIKMSATEVVDVLVGDQDKDFKDDKKGSKDVGNKGSQQPKKRKGETEIAANGTKRMKTNAAVVEEAGVCGTPVKQSRMSSAAGDGSPVVSNSRRATRSSANANGADDSPARRTRSRARADGGC